MTSPQAPFRLQFDARNGSNESALLHSALRLGIVDKLVATPGGIDQDELANGLGLWPRGVRSVLELMISMGLCTRRNLSHVSATAALSGPMSKPEVKAAYAEGARGLALMSKLEEAVRTGEDLDGVLSRCEHVAKGPPSEWSEPEQTLWVRYCESYVRTQVLLVVARLGILPHLAEHEPSDVLCKSIGIHPRGYAALAQMLVRMGILAAGSETRLTPAVVPLFDEKGIAYITRSMEVSARYWEPLARLDETLKSERYFLDLKDPVISAEFYADNSSQISAVFASHFRLARQAAATLKQTGLTDVKNVLDIGTGSGVWGAAFAATYPEAQVTYFDQASVFEQVKSNLTRLKVEGRANLRPGNLFVDEFGEGQYDVITLPQVLNVLSPKDVPNLLARAAKALHPRGVLVIAEYVLSDERDGPLDHLYFQFRRVITNEGDLLSHKEYAALLKDVGLTQTRLHPLPTQEVILSARDGVRLPEALIPQSQAPAAAAK